MRKLNLLVYSWMLNFVKKFPSFLSWAGAATLTRAAERSPIRFQLSKSPELDSVIWCNLGLENWLPVQPVPSIFVGLGNIFLKQPVLARKISSRPNQYIKEIGHSTTAHAQPKFGLVVSKAEVVSSSNLSRIKKKKKKNFPLQNATRPFFFFFF